MSSNVLSLSLLFEELILFKRLESLLVCIFFKTFSIVSSELLQDNEKLVSSCRLSNCFVGAFFSIFELLTSFFLVCIKIGCLILTASDAIFCISLSKCTVFLIIFLFFGTFSS